MSSSPRQPVGLLDLEHMEFPIRATRAGDQIAHQRTRGQFLRHVIGDVRTRNQFGCWAEEYGVQAVIDEMIALLDAAAARAGLPHRSALRYQGNAVHLVPILGFLQEREERYERLLDQTRQRREASAIGFVVAGLYGTTNDDAVPIRHWLARDLLAVFRWEIAFRVYGEPGRLRVPVSPTIAAIVKARTPKKGNHLERNATWNYQTRVQVPPATEEELAIEYWKNKDQGAHQPTERVKDRDYRAAPRVNDSGVRDGIRESQRLLELPEQTEAWKRLEASLLQIQA